MKTFCDGRASLFSKFKLFFVPMWMINAVFTISLSLFPRPVLSVRTTSEVTKVNTEKIQVRNNIIDDIEALSEVHVSFPAIQASADEFRAKQQETKNEKRRNILPVWKKCLGKCLPCLNKNNNDLNSNLSSEASFVQPHPESPCLSGSSSIDSDSVDAIVDELFSPTYFRDTEVSEAPEPPSSSESSSIDSNSVQHCYYRVSADGIVNGFSPSLGSEPETIKSDTVNNNYCCICLDADPSNKDDIVTLPCIDERQDRVPHKFHRDCIQKWLLKRSECPICRKQLPPGFVDSIVPPELRETEKRRRRLCGIPIPSLPRPRLSFGGLIRPGIRFDVARRGRSPQRSQRRESQILGVPPSFVVGPFRADAFASGPTSHRYVGGAGFMGGVAYYSS